MSMTYQILLWHSSHHTEVTCTVENSYMLTSSYIRIDLYLQVL